MKSFRTLLIIIPVTIIFVFILSMNIVPDARTTGSIEEDTLLHARVKKTAEFKNLVVYYLSGDQSLNNAEFITLSEALEKKHVKLIETKNVNQLEISNNSEFYIYINAGDIVKGGQQDRTIGADIIIAPNEKKVPLESFCVEASRWSQRGSEKADRFSSNDQVISSRELRVAAYSTKNQNQVWSNIAEQQSRLNENVSKMKGYNVDIRDTESATSLQLTLENKHLDSLRNEYKVHFIDIPAKHKDVIGFAFAINGELFGADVYNNAKLFKDMWPKLINSVIVEAISEYESDTTTYEEPTNIIEVLNGAYYGNKVTMEINKSTQLVSFETDEQIAFETYSITHSDWIHKSYIMKDTIQVSSIWELDFERQNYYQNDMPVQQRIINPNEINPE